MIDSSRYFSIFFLLTRSAKADTFLSFLLSTISLTLILNGFVDEVERIKIWGNEYFIFIKKS